MAIAVQPIDAMLNGQLADINAMSDTSASATRKPIYGRALRVLCVCVSTKNSC